MTKQELEEIYGHFMAGVQPSDIIRAYGLNPAVELGTQNNALLNYGYSVLVDEIAKFVHGLELDPYYGFFHKADTSFQALMYDLIEPFRWLEM